MMIGSSRVRASPRRPRASASPDWPGSIQSSNNRSGRARRISPSAASASATARTANPASSRLTRNSSWIAGSSSTTRIDGVMASPRSFGQLCADLLRGGMSHVFAPDDVDDVLGDILGVIADAFDRLGDEHDLERRRYRPRIFHHVADELPQDGEERGIDRLIVADHGCRGVYIEPREGVERELQVFLGQPGRPGDDVHAYRGQALAPLHLLRLVGDLLDFVADALELVDDLDHGQDHAQVDRGRLALGDDLAALLV